MISSSARSLAADSGRSFCSYTAADSARFLASDRTTAIACSSVSSTASIAGDLGVHDRRPHHADRRECELVAGLHGNGEVGLQPGLDGVLVVRHGPIMPPARDRGERSASAGGIDHGSGHPGSRPRHHHDEHTLGDAPAGLTDALTGDGTVVRGPSRIITPPGPHGTTRHPARDRHRPPAPPTRSTAATAPRRNATPVATVPVATAATARRPHPDNHPTGDVTADHPRARRRRTAPRRNGHDRRCANRVQHDRARPGEPSGHHHRATEPATGLTGRGYAGDPGHAEHAPARHSPDPPRRAATTPPIAAAATDRHRPTSPVHPMAHLMPTKVRAERSLTPGRREAGGPEGQGQEDQDRCDQRGRWS